MQRDDRPSRLHDDRIQRYRPGHLFRLPSGATWLNRNKARPFALVHPCSRDSMGTLVYGSTQEIERHLGAASLARIDRALCDYFSLPDPPPVR